MAPTRVAQNQCDLASLPNSRASPPFKHAQWSADGTCLITASVTSDIQTFVVPADLLDEDRDEPLALRSYCTIHSPESVNAVVGFPTFHLQDHASALVLSSAREHPIRLNSALSSNLVASYPLVNEMTEQYISPHSLAFNATGTCFVAGSDSAIAVFDVSRPGQEPLTYSKTGPKNSRDSRWNPTTSMRGLVSALAVEVSSSILAAGTFTRSVALYSATGQGDCIGAFSVHGNQADSAIHGAGITQLHWSQCGRYLIITERKSNGVMVYDIRKTGQLLSWVEGRCARSNQRLGVDVSSSTSGRHSGSCEVWAGGVDGRARMWRDPQLQEGALQPCLEFMAHNDAVTSTIMHRAGGVLTTTSAPDYAGNSKNSNELDPSLKIWTT
ncbi:hypothetical protein DV737_g4580, partial [Chaetothyriales sp. CBS 132003]